MRTAPKLAVHYVQYSGLLAVAVCISDAACQRHLPRSRACKAHGHGFKGTDSKRPKPSPSRAAARRSIPAADAAVPDRQAPDSSLWDSGGVPVATSSAAPESACAFGTQIAGSSMPGHAAPCSVGLWGDCFICSTCVWGDKCLWLQAGAVFRVCRWWGFGCAWGPARCARVRSRACGAAGGDSALAQRLLWCAWLRCFRASLLSLTVTCVFLYLNLCHLLEVG